MFGRAHIGIETHKRQQQQQQEAFFVQRRNWSHSVEYFIDSRMSWSIDGFRTAAALQDSLLFTNLQGKLKKIITSVYCAITFPLSQKLRHKDTYGSNISLQKLATKSCFVRKFQACFSIRIPAILKLFKAFLSSSRKNALIN